MVFQLPYQQHRCANIVQKYTSVQKYVECIQYAMTNLVYMFTDGYWTFMSKLSYQCGQWEKEICLLLYLGHYGDLKNTFMVMIYLSIMHLNED